MAFLQDYMLYTSLHPVPEFLKEIRRSFLLLQAIRHALFLFLFHSDKMWFMKIGKRLRYNINCMTY